MFGIFKSKEEKEQAKAEKEVEKMHKEASASAKINEATLKREAAERARTFQGEMDYKRRVYKAEAALMERDESARAALTIAIGALDREQAKTHPHPVDVARCKRRVKNYFYEVVTINRAMKALEECKLNHQWDRGMMELSRTFKLMNDVKTGVGPVKKLIFLYRTKRVESMGNEVFTQVNDYFGANAKPLSEAEMKEYESKYPVDLMISDELFNKIIDTDDMDMYINNPDIVKISPDELTQAKQEINREVMQKGEPPVFEEASDFEAVSDENLEKKMQEMGF